MKSVEGEGISEPGPDDTLLGVAEQVLAVAQDLLRREGLTPSREAMRAAIGVELYLPALAGAGARRSPAECFRRALEAALEAGRDAGDSTAPTSDAELQRSVDVLCERLGAELLEGLEAHAADRAVADGEGASLEASVLAAPGGGGEELDWIRSTLREGGDAGDALVGRLFHDKYRILRKIGAGGFGAVYEAVDERGAMNRVAIKVMLPKAARTRALLDAFRGEAMRVTRLNHPNIVDWKTFDRTPDGTYYFVMELLEGEELHHLLEREGTLPPARAMELLLQILGALRAAHFVSEGECILHLDLKPKNVIVLPARRNRPETVKVIDFGIGQYVGGDEPESGAPSPSARGGAGGADHSQALSTLAVRDDEVDLDAFDFKLSHACTPEYASPEQCVHIEYASRGRGEPRALDGRSDLYSLGVVAYQMLTGRLPFDAPEQRFEYLELHQTAPIDRWRAQDKRVPSKLRRFVERCLAKDPAARFADVAEAYEALERIAHPPAWPRVAMIGGPLVLAALAGALYFGPSAAHAGSPLVLLGEDGAALENEHTVYFGATTPEWELLVGSESGGPLSGVAAAQLTLDVEGEPPAGLSWRLVDGADGSLRLRADADPQLPAGAYFEGVASLAPLTGSEAASALTGARRLRLVWIGEDAWDVEVWAAGARLDGTEPVVLDPRGVTFQVRVAGAAREEVEVPGATFAGAPLGVPERRVPPKEEAVLFEFPLSVAGATSGQVAWSVEVMDGSGRLRTLSRTLDLGPRGLELGSVRITDGQDLALRVSANNEVQWRRGEGYTLEVNSRTPTRLSWRFGGGEAGWSEESEPRLAHVVPLPGLPPELAGATSIDLGLRLRDMVTTARPEDHERSETYKLFPYDRLAPLDVRVLRGGAALAPDEEHTFFLAEADLTVQLLAPSRAPRTVRLSLRSARDGERAALGTETFEWSGATRPTEWTNLDEGEYALTVESFSPRLSKGEKLDTAEGTADQRQEFTLVVDRTPPTLVLVPPREDFVWEPGLESIPIGLDYEIEHGRAPQLDWSLEEVEGPFSASGVLESRSVLNLAQLLEPAAPDGEFRLTVAGEDVAGNAIVPCTWTFTRAVHPPALALQVPRFDRALNVSWQPWPVEGDELTVMAFVTDPNGIRAVRGWIYLRDPGAAERREPLALELVRDAGTGDAWSATVQALEAWSGAEGVYLALAAVPEQGQPGPEVEYGPFRIDALAPVYAETLRVEFGDRDVTSMRLVAGNTEPYRFRGRSAADENVCIRGAGLDYPKFVSRGVQEAGAKETWDLAFATGALQPYYLDVHEVGVGQYLDFLDDREGGYSSAAAWKPGNAPADGRYEALRAELASRDPRLPVTGLSLVECDAYARWAGKRLPTLVEFEYAARGGVRYRAFAGDRQDGSAPLDLEDLTVVTSRGFSAPLAVDREPFDCSDLTPDTGLRDLAGNVAEWTQTPYVRGSESRDTAAYLPADLAPLRSATYWVAGGSFRSPNFDFREALVQRPDQPASHIGFRCAVSAADTAAARNNIDPTRPTFRAE